MEKAQAVGLKLNKDGMTLCQTKVRYMGRNPSRSNKSRNRHKHAQAYQCKSHTVIRDFGFVKYLAKFVPHLSETHLSVCLLSPFQNRTTFRTDREGMPRLCEKFDLYKDFDYILVATSLLQPKVKN